MKKTFLLLIILLLLFPSVVFADAAPTGQAPGANIVPGTESTNVEMATAYIAIVVKSKPLNDTLGQADVDANFSMKNLGFTSEFMKVLIPLTSLAADTNANPAPPEIQDVTVTIDKIPATVQRVMWGLPGEPDTPWAEFSVTFPIMKEVLIDVKYSITGIGVYPYESFKYLLGFKTQWYGRTTRANINVYLSYDANNQDIFQGEDMGWLATTAFGRTNNNLISWGYKDTILDKSSALQVSVVVPAAWQAVLKERANVTKTPSDGQAWERLADLYKSLLVLPQGMRLDPGGQDLYALGLEAYQKAITLQPNDADCLSDDADLLYNHFYWTQATGVQPDPNEINLALKALQRALEINPNNVKAAAVLAKIQANLPGMVAQLGGTYNFLGLTVTPTIDTSLSTPAPTATSTPALTVTAIAPSMPTSPVTQNTPKKAAPLCGGSALIPILVVGLVWLRRGKRSAR